MRKNLLGLYLFFHLDSKGSPLSLLPFWGRTEGGLLPFSLPFEASVVMLPCPQIVKGDGQGTPYKAFVRFYHLFTLYEEGKGKLGRGAPRRFVKAKNFSANPVLQAVAKEMDESSAEYMGYVLNAYLDDGTLQSSLKKNEQYKYYGRG